MYIKVTRLSPEELAEQYKLLRQGDPNAKKRIIEAHIPMALHLLKGKQCRDDVIVAEVLYGITEAVEQIQKRPEETPNIPGYITLWVGGRIKRFYFEQRKRLVPYKIAKVPFNNQFEVDELLERFTPQQRFIIEARLAGKDDSEIGEELGCTRQNVHLKRKEIRNVYSRLVR